MIPFERVLIRFYTCSLNFVVCELLLLKSLVRQSINFYFFKDIVEN